MAGRSTDSQNGGSDSNIYTHLQVYNYFCFNFNIVESIIEVKILHYITETIELLCVQWLLWALF